MKNCCLLRLLFLFFYASCSDPAPSGLHVLDSPETIEEIVHTELELSDELEVAPEEILEVVQELPAPPTLLPMPPSRALSVASSGFGIGPNGGNIVAGDLIVEFPSNAVSETTAIEVNLLTDPSELNRELPPGLILGAASISSWNPGLIATVSIYMPLAYTLEPGSRVELLAWHPSMLAFLTIASARVDESGSQARFPVRQFGDMIVRAAPIQRNAAIGGCEEAAPRLNHAWPTQSESRTVGLTPEEDRIPRTLAFNVLTDYRLSPFADQVNCKNEEFRNSSATRANELDHQDEDFIMDPNAAAALTSLVQLIDGEWIDPFTGESSYRVRITEAYDSLIEHSRRSTHYQGRALDLTLDPIPLPSFSERVSKYGRLSALSICAGFDYVLFENQYHIHASVRQTRLAIAAIHEETHRIQTLRIDNPTYRYAFTELPNNLNPLSTFTWPLGDRMEVASASAGSGLSVSAESTTPIATANFRNSDSAENTRTIDGLREVVIRGGQAYLIYSDGRIPLGSVNSDGNPVPLEYPFPISTVDEQVTGVTFLHHQRTAETWIQ